MKISSELCLFINSSWNWYSVQLHYFMIILILKMWSSTKKHVFQYPRSFEVIHECRLTNSGDKGAIPNMPPPRLPFAITPCHVNEGEYFCLSFEIIDIDFINLKTNLDLLTSFLVTWFIYIHWQVFLRYLSRYMRVRV